MLRSPRAGRSWTPTIVIMNNGRNFFFSVFMVTPTLTRLSNGRLKFVNYLAFPSTVSDSNVFPELQLDSRISNPKLPMSSSYNHVPLTLNWWNYPSTPLQKLHCEIEVPVLVTRWLVPKSHFPTSSIVVIPQSRRASTVVKCGSLSPRTQLINLWAHCVPISFKLYKLTPLQCSWWILS